MKTVFTNDGVAHAWAAQTQSHGNSGNGNFSFRDSLLLSYATPIARLATAVDGARVALLTSKTYSITTSAKHMNPAWRATRHLKQFYVPFIAAQGGKNRIDANNITDAHVNNLEALRVGYVTQRESLANPRKRLWRAPLDELNELAEKARDYAQTFNLPAPAFDPVADAQSITETRAAYDAKHSSPEAIAKRAKDKTRKLENLRAHYRAGENINSLASGWRAQQKLRDMMTDADHKARAENIARIAAVEIADWRAGGKQFHFDADCGGAALRIMGNELQTSHGAAVPLAHAIKAFRFVKLCRERGQGWQANGHSLRVGLFAIGSIDADGNFRAGCHVINWPEIERAARAANVWDDMPSDEALTPSHHAA